MTPRTNHKRLDPEGQAMIGELLQERMLLAVKFTLIQVLEEEVEAFVNAAPYQRTSERRDYRNGTYQRDLRTTLGQIEDLPVPRTRQGFRSEIFERYQRRNKLSIYTRKCSTHIHPHRASNLQQHCATFATDSQVNRIIC